MPQTTLDNSTTRTSPPRIGDDSGLAIRSLLLISTVIHISVDTSNTDPHADVRPESCVVGSRCAPIPRISPVLSECTHRNRETRPRRCSSPRPRHSVSRQLPNCAESTRRQLPLSVQTARGQTASSGMQHGAPAGTSSPLKKCRLSAAGTSGSATSPAPGSAFADSP